MHQNPQMIASQKSADVDPEFFVLLNC